MPKFDNDILLKNIKLQMEKSHETQKQVADAIGMSQPNFNKAINGVDSKLFTLEQIYNISQHFKISIDRLMSNYLDVFKLYNQGAFSKEIYEAAVDGLLQKADIDFLL